MKLKTILMATAVLGTFFMQSTAYAAVTVTFEEVDSAVVATTSGSLNLDGLTKGSTAIVPAGIDPAGGAFTATPGVGDVYFGLTGNSIFGSGQETLATTTNGDIFYILSNPILDLEGLAVNQGYVSGQSIFATTTFANSTFASLGLTLGTYIINLPNDTVTIQIGSAVPEPATWAMFLLGFGAVGYSMRRRQGTATRISFA